ncbi:golgi-body localization protein domain-containing protein [Mycena amicta]|nr:golgi-body localization protein domain-containing protein [Mycena amicta]
MVVDPILYILSVLLPEDVWWTTLSLWLVRLVAFSLLLRTYIIPWTVGRMSKHLRVRSISFRSIRGLYARFGGLTLRAERITWSWSRTDRLTLAVHGSTLQLGRKAPPQTNTAHTKTKLAPSPITNRLWALFSTLYSLVDPFLRPLIRSYFAACLRLVIGWVPRISQALALDLHSPTITFAEVPGAKIVANTVSFRTALAFTQTGKVVEAATQPPKSSSHARSSYSVAAWRHRLTNSMQRSWERAWGQTHGTATVHLKFQEIIGSVADATFFKLPDSITFDASLGFSPRSGSVDPHSVDLSLVLSDAHIDVRALVTLFGSLKRATPAVYEPQVPTLEVPLSPDFRDVFQAPLLSPVTPSMSFFSPISPTTPRSPFFGAFSVSTISRRAIPPSVKLKDSADKSKLAFLASATFRVSKITATIANDSNDEEVYKAVVHDINLSSKISHPEHTPLHRRWLGSGKKIDVLDAQGHVCTFATGQVKVDRKTSHSQLSLLVIKSTDLQALATQWPTPWLHSSPFIAGDPNAPLLAVQAHLGTINVTERLDRLTRLFADREPRLPSRDVTVETPAPTSSQGHALPRISFELECEPMFARLIVGSKPADPSALDLRMDGLVVCASTRYSHRRSLRTMPLAITDSFPLQLHGSVDAVLRPLFLRVRSKESGDSFSEDPVLLSIEAIELSAHGSADASIGEDGHIAMVDLPSKMVQLHCTTDALCGELWHPLVIDTLTEIISSLPPKAPGTLSSTPASSIVDKLPRGIFATVSLARCVFIVTAPDINPDDHMDLCRGFAARATGLSMQYCSLLANPDRHSDWRSATRQKLYLPQETLLPVLLATLRTNSAAALISVTLPDLALRSAVSSQYDADDPLLAERDDPNLKGQEFLCLQGSHALVALSSGTFWPTVSMVDSCEVTLTVPYVRGTLQLAHVYSSVLGVATLKQLAQARPRDLVTHPPTPTSTRPLLLTTTVTIRTIQIMCVLLKQRAVVRLDSIKLMAAPDASAVASWDRAIAWVKVHAQTGFQSGCSEDRWEEFACLQKWKGSFNSGAIEVEADNAKIRIPHGFILADLILDISVIVKAARHLSRICLFGRYYAMPTPEAEGPKKVPRLLLNIRSLIAEASDDPFESNLGVILRTGLDAAMNRIDREEAFDAKVQSILAAEAFTAGRNQENPDYNFDSNHSISVDEARQRLNEVHSVDWMMRLNIAKQRQAKDEESVSRKHLGSLPMRVNHSIANLVPVSPVALTPPLIRLLFTNITLNLAPPSFSLDDLPQFLHDQGHGLPLDTQYSLLVPMHLNFGLSSLRVTLRDYPLPLVYIPPREDKTLFVLDFDSDLVVAEEMGTDLSVDWVDCLVVSSDYGLPGAAPFSLSVPKTIMPVKSYANPVIEVTASAPTACTWGVSYGPATQDLMRVVETLSTAPRDASPGVGFWDKMRLIFHWTIKADFAGEVRYQMKGLRDPYIVHGAGAGFVLAWQGNPRLLVAQKNHHKELIQVFSESMVIAVPDFSHLLPKTKRKRRRDGDSEKIRPFAKICAKLRSGVCFGVGFVMERACGPECTKCSGSPFHRNCRFYDFRPHYDVKLEKKPRVPEIKTADDSYNGFRSDFIHLSTSLSSALNAKSGLATESSSFYMTPQAFSHFWSWWKLFDGVLSLPIRQGSAWPARHISPKFGRHLATLKYRISIKNLYIMHAYLDDSRETWADGVTPWIGVKGIIEEFKVDMHQREEEAVMPGARPGTTKLVRRKPFYAVELVIRGLDLRAMLATFDDPLKVSVGVSSSPQRSNYRTRTDLPRVPADSVWHDEDDFIELDWTPRSAPLLHLLPVVTCPRFTYFRRAATIQGQDEGSKFGMESTHTCFLGKQSSVLEVQIDLAKARVAELQGMLDKSDGNKSDVATTEKMCALLQDYISLLQDTQAGSRSPESGGHSYHIPADTLSEAEWAEFDNVYQIHCPKIFLDSAIRDIMMQYYYCSQRRRSVEYHMATRAVKFIRDQAEQVSVVTSPDKHRSLGAAQAAAHALKKILSGHERTSIDDRPVEDGIGLNPLDGWFEGVSLQKGHCCLLLKPQIVLRDDWSSERSCVVAAVQAKLQSYAILDDANVDDPISGKVMSRTFTTLSGLQTFSPASADYSGDGCVPLEVLIDFRCESNDFERLVPQTDATFHYDKFNRLRLRNNTTSVVRSHPEKTGAGAHNHLHDQTDLIQVNIPRFTVTAIDQHFQTISNIVAKLLLFSDAAHKTRMNKLETLLFTYDFNDLASVADVVTDLQTNLRDAIETELMADIAHLTPEAAQLEMLKLKAHKMLLSEELGGLFECIALAQDQRDHQSEPKSALLLHTSSSEISWRMLDEQRELLAKLVVQNIDFFWLKRQDSSTVNNLTVGNLQAFDGSRDARWTEILSKHDEPANHPLLKRGLFVLANWSVLAPVGGITIYEAFELNFHPMRLQVDARVGRRIMEYVWPGRKDRNPLTEDETPPTTEQPSTEIVLARSSLDSPRAQVAKKATLSAPTLAPPMKLSASRSFTDLRSASLAPPLAPQLHRTASSGALRQVSPPDLLKKKGRSDTGYKSTQVSKTGDAAEMKTRSSQKSFVLVRISSLNLLLSVMKEESFVCRDAHIRTRDLEFRNQTWSFEELVGQFIPSDMSWRGWIKMAFHQPLVPVLPVARELISKTKWIASNKDLHAPTPQKPLRKTLPEDDGVESDRSHSPHLRWGRRRKKTDPPPPTILPGAAFTTDPEEASGSRPPSRNRKFTIKFGRNKGNGSTSEL